MALHSNGGNRYVSDKNYSSKISRTKVSNLFEWRSTFSAGRLIPGFAQEVYPGEWKSPTMGELVRSITPLGPVMDKSFLDIFFFFVPYRLVWDHWEEFIAGYNKEAWTRDVVYTTPKILLPIQVLGEGDTPNTGSEYLHSFLDYLPGACDVCEYAINGYYDDGVGAPTKAEQEAALNKVMAISALYPRAYVKIWNDWFRDENLQDEYELYTGDNDEYADQFCFNLLDADSLPSAAKYHNRFTSALPQPQKGPDVLIPMNNLVVNPPVGDNFKLFLDGSTTSRTMAVSANASGLRVLGSAVGSDPVNIVGTNLQASNVSNTIRMLRLATQTELLLARDARGGTRYCESLLSHFGVHNGDARLQRSEYLGSRQVPLNVVQVTNTAASADNPLGNVGGQSVTKDAAHYFSKSFSEHGVVFMVYCVRTNLSYSSGVRKEYQRWNRFDYIWPEFKHLGDVPLYQRELEISLGTSPSLTQDPDMVFGYTPYGSELREGYNFNNGLFRHKAPGNLSYLTYQESYDDDNIPVLSSGWIEQPNSVVSNTLVSQLGPQFYALFELKMDRVIPLDPTSDPGLMDHF